jgi:hypothetical protein
MTNVLKPCLADRLALIRQERAEAAKKREEEKAGMSSMIFFSCLFFADIPLRMNFDTDNSKQLFQPKNKRRLKLASKFRGACRTIKSFSNALAIFLTFYMSV